MTQSEEFTAAAESWQEKWQPSWVSARAGPSGGSGPCQGCFCHKLTPVSLCGRRTFQAPSRSTDVSIVHPVLGPSRKAENASILHLICCGVLQRKIKMRVSFSCLFFCCPSPVVDFPKLFSSTAQVGLLAFNFQMRDNPG